MEVDPTSLDPEWRTAKFLALASVSFGILSLCSAIIPACGGMTSVAGILCGLYAMKHEESKMGLIGVAISGLGLIITIVHGLFVVLFK